MEKYGVIITQFGVNGETRARGYSTELTHNGRRMRLPVEQAYFPDTVKAKCSMLRDSLLERMKEDPSLNRMEAEFTTG